VKYEAFMLTTAHLLPGYQVRFLGFGQADSDYRRKLLALGMLPGVMVQVVRVAPFGCPVELSFAGVLLALRRDEAAALQWELVCSE